MVLANSLAPVFLTIYIKWRKLHLQTWGGWSFESLTEWWQFLRLGLPGMLLIAFEWWSFEISTLVSGSIDEIQLAISATILQLGTIYYMVSRAQNKLHQKYSSESIPVMPEIWIIFHVSWRLSNVRSFWCISVYLSIW